MARAIELSLGGFPAPNPRVGCVIVKNGQIIGEGYHDHAGAPHAEAIALASVSGDVSGATLYVTQEPCNHQGRTPPCSLAVISAGVKEVFIATEDPNPKAEGGIEALQNAGIVVHLGLGADKVEQVNWIFLTAQRRGRPVVCIKAATTLDGFMAAADGHSKWITGEKARQEGHRLRAEMGSVLVGRATVDADDPLLTARIAGVVNQPRRLVLDPSGKLEPTKRVFGGDAQTTWYVTGGHRIRDEQTVAQGSGSFDLNKLLEKLFEEGVIGVLVEGGPRTIKGFFNRGLVDRLDMFVAPKFLGSGIKFEGSSKKLYDLRLSSIQRWDDDVQMSYFLGPRTS